MSLFPTGFLLKKSNGTQNIFYPRTKRSSLAFMSLVLLLFLVLLSTKELWNHFKYHCNWAV